MTNTKFRKRALLSSVAMLLVALVALGSATFAWFSSSPNANIGNLTAATTQSSNLLLKQYTAEDWASSITFDTAAAKSLSNQTETYVVGTASMTPVTTNAPSTTVTSFSTATAPSLDHGKASADVGEISAFSGHVAVASIYLKYGDTTTEATTGTANIPIHVTVSATGTSANSYDYLRVALVPMSAALTLTQDDTTGSESIESAFLADSATGDDHALSPNYWKDETTTTDLGSPVNGALGSAIYLGKALTNKTYGYYAYVYFEGTDDDCIDTEVGSIGNVSFAFAATV